jgi:ATP-binding cassette, subfamily B, bacterial
MAKFPFYQQHDVMDCGPTCLRMIARHYGKAYSLQYLRDNAFITREGVSLLGISKAAENIGFRTVGVQITFENLVSEAPLPCIIHWNQNHFVVVHKITTSRVFIADPCSGILDYSIEEFKKNWIAHENGELGIALLLEPSPRFYETDKDEETQTVANSLNLLLRYLKRYRRYIVQLLIGLLLGSIIQLILHSSRNRSSILESIPRTSISFIYCYLGR